MPRGILNNLPIDFPCYVANVWEPHLVCNAIPVHIFVRPRPESYYVFLPKDPKDGIYFVNNKSYSLFVQGDSDFGYIIVIAIDSEVKMEPIRLGILLSPRCKMDSRICYIHAVICAIPTVPYLISIFAIQIKSFDLPSFAVVSLE